MLKSASPKKGRLNSSKRPGSSGQLFTRVSLAQALELKVLHFLTLSDLGAIGRVSRAAFQLLPAFALVAQKLVYSPLACACHPGRKPKNQPTRADAVRVLRLLAGKPCR